MQCSIVSEVKR